jgi:hypothetical protein
MAGVVTNGAYNFTLCVPQIPSFHQAVPLPPAFAFSPAFAFAFAFSRGWYLLYLSQ